jgi:hypothetical protein
MQMREQGIGKNNQDYAAHGVERGEGQPQNSEQTNVFRHSTAPRKTYCSSRKFFTAPATETLIWLCWSTALVAEHISSVCVHCHLQGNTDHGGERFPAKRQSQTWIDSTAKRKGHPATQAAFSSRENSSNGGMYRQNFLAKSYEPKKRGVKEFLRNKYLWFQ